MLPGSMYSKSLCPYTTCCLPAINTREALRGTFAMCHSRRYIKCSSKLKTPALLNLREPSAAQADLSQSATGQP